jgi:hypothetical protein
MMALGSLKRKTIRRSDSNDDSDPDDDSDSNDDSDPDDDSDSNNDSDPDKRSFTWRRIVLRTLNELEIKDKNCLSEKYVFQIKMR